MMISTTKRFIFAANSKSGSTAIEHALAPYALPPQTGVEPLRKHLPLPEFVANLPDVFSDPDMPLGSFFIFGVMRDPMEWIESWYRYRIGNKVKNPLPEGMSFEGFWRQRGWNIQRKDGRKALQRDMFVDHTDTVLADVIIPFSRLEVMISEIFGLLAIPNTLTRRNVSAIKASDDLIPPSLWDEVREHYQRDYELFDRLDTINATGMEKLRRVAQAK